jgi:geranylgeranyl diphosphate synthase type I
MDIHWHNEKEIRVDEAQYLEMCACKTGCLGRIVARLAAIVTGQSDDVEDALARYAQDLSVAFQIGDDILDVEHTLERTGEFGKAFGNDVREGKKTLMVIHAAANAPAEDVARLEEILWTDDNTDAEIHEVVEILQAAGSIEYARERALELSESAREHLAEVDLEPEPAAQLAEFTRFVVERDA